MWQPDVRICWVFLYVWEKKVDTRFLKAVLLSENFNCEYLSFAVPIER